MLFTRLFRLILDGSSLALSIRDFDQRTNDFIVKHYKIRKMDNGGCFIAPKRTFAHVVALVNHYKGTPMFVGDERRHGFPQEVHNWK